VIRGYSLFLCVLLFHAVGVAGLGGYQLRFLFILVFAGRMPAVRTAIVSVAFCRNQYEFGIIGVYGNFLTADI